MGFGPIKIRRFSPHHFIFMRESGLTYYLDRGLSHPSPEPCQMSVPFTVPLVLNRGGVLSGRGGCMVGRFNDPVETRGRLLAKVVDEVIEEEPSEDKETEQLRRRQPRRRYKRGSKLLLDTEGGKFEGTVASASLADGDRTSKNQAGQQAPPRYVLFRMNEARTEVQVVPVSEWFNFRKPAVAAAKLLEEVDEDFEVRKSLLKEKRERYKRISQALNAAEEASPGDEEMLPSEVFGAAVRRGRKSKPDSLRLKAESLLEESSSHLDEVGEALSLT